MRESVTAQGLGCLGGACVVSAEGHALHGEMSRS